MSAAESRATGGPAIEVISDAGTVLAYLLRAEVTSDRTRFLTPQELNLQLGLIVYKGGQRVAPHRHLPVVRTTRGTMEAIVVREGLCDVDIYDEAQRRVATRTLVPGDVVLLVGGGHGFRMREDTVLLEVKEGPYVEGNDKVTFDDPGQ